MHQINIPEQVQRSIVRRRGRLHIYEALAGASTALLVIDLQNAFMLPGMPSEMPVARAIVPNVNRLAQHVRRAGGKVVWVKMTCTENDRTEWSTYFDGMSAERGRDMIEHLTPGTHGHAVFADLDVQPDDLQIEKSRYSVFPRHSSDIDAVLRDAGIDTVLIAGTLTNTCCESSARDAMMLDYKTVMVSDANATRSDDEHNATLVSFLQGFGDVYSTDEVIALLQAADGADR